MIEMWNQFIYTLQEWLEPRCFGATRSPMWAHVRAEFLKTHPTCAVCGGKENLQCHHKMPFHLDSSLELNPDNLITLCEGSGGHHLWFGHLGNFKSYNKDVESDSTVFNQKIITRP